MFHAADRPHGRRIHKLPSGSPLAIAKRFWHAPDLRRRRVRSTTAREGRCFWPPQKFLPRL